MPLMRGCDWIPRLLSNNDDVLAVALRISHLAERRKHKGDATEMKGPTNLLIAIVRMHHISNPHKFRRLKRYAAQSQVSGLAKKGKPGIVVFDGQPQSIKEFLAHARGLRYLDFHHVGTRELVDSEKRIADAHLGLHDVESMNDLVEAMDRVSLKAWFRESLGMSGPG